MASQSPMHITDAADLYDPAIQKMFVKVADKFPEKYKEICSVETGVEDYIRKDSSLSGFGEADFVDPENAVIVSESPVQGYDQTYTQVEFGKVASFTKRMWKFGIKKRDMTRIVEDLRKACSRKRERLVSERLDNGWATSYSHTGDNGGNRTISTAGGDAAALFSASHTREDGGTNWNNVVYDGTTYNMDADYDALKALGRTESLVRDPKGNLMQDLTYDTLVVAKGSTPFYKFSEIMGALKKGWKPVSADHDGSGVREMKILELPLLTNKDYWYAFDSSKLDGYQYGLQYLESQPIQLEGPNIVFKTGEIQYKSTLMFALGHNDARSWAGSKGTNAA